MRQRGSDALGYDDLYFELHEAIWKGYCVCTVTVHREDGGLDSPGQHRSRLGDSVLF